MERLRAWLQSNPPEWRDFEAEIRICLENSVNVLRTAGCTNRDFMAGECSGLQMILDFCEIYKDMRILTEKDVD